MFNLRKPKISVLMTIYNHDKFLKSAIKSIISQKFKDWELLAIDNGSTDNTKKILKKIKNKKIRCFFLKKNIGRTNCLNYGLKLCRGKFIAILDSDDLAKKNRFETQINEFNKNNEVALVGSNYNLINEKGKILKEINFSAKINQNPRLIFFKNPIAHSTIMFKKNLIKKIGQYSKNMKYAQDYLFILKVLKKNKIVILNKNLAKIRINHKLSETWRQKKNNLIKREEIKILIWCYNNFNFNLKEKLLFIYHLLKKILYLLIFNQFLFR